MRVACVRRLLSWLSFGLGPVGLICGLGGFGGLGGFDGFGHGFGALGRGGCSSSCVLAASGSWLSRLLQGRSPARSRLPVLGGAVRTEWVTAGGDSGRGSRPRPGTGRFGRVCWSAVAVRSGASGMVRLCWGG